MTLVQGQVLDSLGTPQVVSSVFIVSAPQSMPDIAQLTDEQGRFTLTVPVPGHYVIGVRSESGVSTQVEFVVTDEKSVPVEVRLESAKGGNQ